MDWLLAPPSTDDLVRLLKAWRFWLLAVVIGALIGAAVYYVAPPPYRARATVVVDFNLEQTRPEDNDRQLFYYLERETRKLKELAWSDAVLETVSQAGNVSVSQLRDGVLTLSQPGEGGWHFYADRADAQSASTLAGAWAQAFAEQVQLAEKNSEKLGLGQNIQVEVTQASNLPKRRRTQVSSYALAGAAATMALSALLVLFVRPKKDHSSV
jgi:capsular polysaccharide biosynthesis protein